MNRIQSSVRREESSESYLLMNPAAVPVLTEEPISRCVSPAKGSLDRADVEFVLGEIIRVLLLSYKATESTESTAVANPSARANRASRALRKLLSSCSSAHHSDL